MMLLRFYDGREIHLDGDLLPIMTEKEWEDADAVGAAPPIVQIVVPFDPDIDEDPAHDRAYADEREAQYVDPHEGTRERRPLPPESFEPDDPNVPQ